MKNSILSRNMHAYLVYSSSLCSKEIITRQKTDTIKEEKLSVKGTENMGFQIKSNKSLASLLILGRYANEVWFTVFISYTMIVLRGNIKITHSEVACLEVIL